MNLPHSAFRGIAAVWLAILSLCAVLPAWGQGIVCVGNTVFSDSNYNGVRDESEGVDGVVLQIFPDGADPLVDAPVQQVASFNGGKFLFTSIPDGNYFIFVPPAEFQAGGHLPHQISVLGTNGVGADDDAGEDGIDEDDPATTGVRSEVFAVVTGGSPVSTGGGIETGFDSAWDDATDANIDLTIDLGFMRNLGVGNLVYHDSNSNGHADAGEGVPNILVQLFANGQTPGIDSPAAESVTDALGRYAMRSLLPGGYFVHVPLAEFASGKMLNGLEPKHYPSGNPAGDDDAGSDGIYAPGVNDPESEGISTATFTLAMGGAPVQATGESGDDAASDDATDNDVDLTRDFEFNLPNGKAKVGNLVFIDANYNSMADVDEGVDGVTVKLFAQGDDPLTDPPIDSAVTHSGGRFILNATPGTRFLFIPPGDFSSGGPLEGMVSVFGVRIGAGDDNTGEVGLDAANPAATGISSLPFAVQPGTAPTAATGEAGTDAWTDNFKDGDIDLTRDFGFVSYPDRPVGAGNLVFVDADGDGESDPGEGVDGVLVRLFANGQSVTEGPVAETTTAGGGHYFFSGLEPGRYFLHLPASNFTSGGPLEDHLANENFAFDNGIDDQLDHNGIPVSNPAATGIVTGLFNLIPGAEPVNTSTEEGLGKTQDDAADSDSDLTLDFGLHLDCPSFLVAPANPLPTAEVGVFYSVAFNASGGASPYTWSLSGSLPAGLSFNSSTSTVSGTPSIETVSNFTLVVTDSEGCRTNAARTITVVPASPKVAVGNTVFIDGNRNNRFDSGEGIAGVQLKLFAQGANPATGTPVAATTTGGGGIYSFTNLIPGNYFVHVPAEEFKAGGQLIDHVSVPGSGPDDGSDDDADENGVDAAAASLPVSGLSSIVFNLGLGQEPTDNDTEQGNDAVADNAADSSGDLTIDLGFIPAYNGTLGAGNLVFVDGNGNHAFDAGEGRDDVTVQLFFMGDDPQATSPAAQTTTANGGRYFFGNLAPAVYFVHIPAAEFQAGGDLEGLMSMSGWALDTGGDDDADENGVDAADPQAAGVSSSLFELAAYTEPVDALSETGQDAGSDNGARDDSIDLTIDLGFGQGCPPFTISPSIVPAAAVGVFYTQTFTASGGSGTYTFGTAGTVPPGLSISPATGVLSGTPVAAGSFGFSITATDSVGCTSSLELIVAVHDPQTTAGAGNVVFVDANTNGHFDPGEGIGGVLVRLFREGDDPAVAVPAASQYTDLLGNYLFLGLEPGGWFVHVPASQFQAGGPLEDKISVAGDGSDDGADDQLGENGVNAPVPQIFGVSSHAFSLALGSEPVDGGTEAGFNAASDNAADANIDLTIDLGFIPQPPITLGVGNMVFADANGNRRFDPGEGVDGVTVKLFNENDDPQTAPAAGTVETAGGGKFLIGGLPEGRFFIHVPKEEFLAGGSLEGKISVFGAGADAALDDDRDENGLDAANPAATGVSSIVFDLAEFAEPLDQNGETGHDSGSDNAADEHTNLTIDLGFRDPCPTILISPSAPLNGTMGQPFSTAFSAFNGAAPYAFTKTGAVPDGLSLSSDGLLSGTPSVTGVWNFTVTATDASGCQGSAAIQVTIHEPSATVAVGSLVFFDANANGYSDAGEGVNGVTVELFRSGETPGVTPPFRTATTSDGGLYLITSLPAGSYFIHVPPAMFATGSPLFNKVSVPTAGSGDDDTDDNGQDALNPAATGVSTALFSLVPDGEPTDASAESGPGSNLDNADDDNGDMTIDLGFMLNAAANFAAWQAQHPLGGQNGFSQNPDGDGTVNLLEYAYDQAPDSGVNEAATPGFRVERNPATGKVDAVLVRRAGGWQDLSAQLEAFIGGSWTSLGIIPQITFNGDGYETVRYADIESDPLLSGITCADIRLHVWQTASPANETWTPVWNWCRTTAPPALPKTFSMPMVKQEVFAGAVDSASTSSVDITTAVGAADIGERIRDGRQHYIEVISGDNEGHRFDINEAASTATALQIDGGSPRNTTSSFPANLAGDEIAVRAHWTFAELFPPADFHATNSQGTADRLLLFDRTTGAIFTCWLFSNAGSPKWVLAGDATLASQNNRIFDAIEGCYLSARSLPVTTAMAGVTRSNDVICSLIAGTNFIGTFWPVSQSPANRGMTVAGGFTGANSQANADRIRVWDGDSAGFQSYTGYYLLKVGAIERWVKEGDTTLTDRSSEALFPAYQASFLISKTSRPAWRIPAPAP